MLRKRINLKFTVETSLDENDIERLAQARGSVVLTFEVLNEIFREDNNIWEAFYTAALEALNKENGTDA